MATTTANVTKTFTAGGTIKQYALVHLASDGDVEEASASTSELRVGFAITAAASGDPVTVALLNGGGTAYGIIDEAISVGDALFADAAGELEKSTNTGQPVGYALQAGAEGDVIEVLMVNVVNAAS